LLVDRVTRSRYITLCVRVDGCWVDEQPVVNVIGRVAACFAQWYAPGISDTTLNAWVRCATAPPYHCDMQLPSTLPLRFINAIIAAAQQWHRSCCLQLSARPAVLLQSRYINGCAVIVRFCLLRFSLPAQWCTCSLQCNAWDVAGKLGLPGYLRAQ
jgi:hypothetical protein